MATLRLLNDGTWSKPPVLTAARKLLIDGLSRYMPARPLGKLASFLNGTSYDQGLLSDGGMPIIRISNMSNPRSEYISTVETFDSKYRVVPGDLLVSWSASFKSIIWPGPVGILNQHIFKVTELPGNQRGFIRHAIEAVFDDMQQRVVGIGMMHLRRDDFLGYPVPVPDSETQARVSAFLDWIESGREGDEPELPEELREQRCIIARIEELLAKVDKVRVLRAETEAEVEALCRSIVLNASNGGSQLTPMSELLKLKDPDVIVKPDETYHFAGVYCFGGGVFRGRVRRGTEFAYTRLTRLESGDFVYPKLMAWEGALGVVPPSCGGLVVSPEFPVFEVDERRVLPEVLDVYFRDPAVWPSLGEISTGTNVRRRRLHPSRFLSFRLPLPSMDVQKRLREVKRKVEDLKSIRADNAAEVDALTPSILSKAFSGEL